MYRNLIKRMIEVTVSGETPEELLTAMIQKKTEERIISDTFMVEDEKGNIIAKQKAVYDGVGKVIRFENLY